MITLGFLLYYQIQLQVTKLALAGCRTGMEHIQDTARTGITPKMLEVLMTRGFVTRTKQETAYKCKVGALTFCLKRVVKELHTDSLRTTN